MGGAADDAMLTNVLGVPTSKGQDIVVYQHLEKEGMVAEVLSAATSDALYEYLTRKGLKVEKDSIPIFRDYIKKNFRSSFLGSARRRPRNRPKDCK